MFTHRTESGGLLPTTLTPEKLHEIKEAWKKAHTGPELEYVRALEQQHCRSCNGPLERDREFYYLCCTCGDEEHKRRLKFKDKVRQSSAEEDN